jgi:hypothetical protein
MKADWLVIRSSAMSFRIDRRVPVMLFFFTSSDWGSNGNERA